MDKINNEILHLEKVIEEMKDGPQKELLEKRLNYLKACKVKPNSPEQGQPGSGE